MRIWQERRLGLDRRARWVSLRYPERRSGFDRRLCTSPGWRCALDREMRLFRQRRSAVLLVLATIVVFNYLDLTLTVRALQRGAGEANPLMAALLAADPMLAVVVKLTIGGAVALMLLALSRFKRVLQTSLLLLVGFSALVGYHAVFALRIS